MTLIDELNSLLGSERVRDHPLDLEVFSKDAGVTKGDVIAAVLPETVEEVAAVVRIARRHKTAIVPRVAGTGLAGVAVAVKSGFPSAVM